MSNSTQNALSLQDSIAALPLFEGVEGSLLQGLIASARVGEQAKGTPLLRQNQTLSRYFIVLDGWCGIYKGNQNGQESILQILGKNDFLPEPELGPQDVSPFNVQALTDMRLLMLPPTLIRSLMQNSPAFMRNMLKAAMRRNHELRDHIEQLTLRNAEERVGRFLLQVRLETVNDKHEFILPFDKTMVASYLGIKPETLSRTLQLFRERGFVVDRNRMIQPEFDSLCDFCDSTTAQKCSHAHTHDCPNPDFTDIKTV